MNELHAYSTIKGLNSEFVIHAIDDFVLNKCSKGRSIIVVDNARIHHSEAFKAKIPQWKGQNVFIFYLPTYSPHLNLIETFWRKCKYEWLLPKHFVWWQAVRAQIDDIMQFFGSKYAIDFSYP